MKPDVLIHCAKRTPHFFFSPLSEVKWDQVSLASIATHQQLHSNTDDEDLDGVPAQEDEDDEPEEAPVSRDAKQMC